MSSNLGTVPSSRSLDRVSVSYTHLDVYKRQKQESTGLGLFVRSLVGLDREAAKHAFGSFLHENALGANQIEFVNLIIDHLTQCGWMPPSALYESPFIDEDVPRVVESRGRRLGSWYYATAC